MLTCPYKIHFVSLTGWFLHWIPLRGRYGIHLWNTTHLGLRIFCSTTECSIFLKFLLLFKHHLKAQSFFYRFCLAHHLLLCKATSDARHFCHRSRGFAIFFPTPTYNLCFWVLPPFWGGLIGYHLSHFRYLHKGVGDKQCVSPRPPHSSGFPAATCPF